MKRCDNCRDVIETNEWYPTIARDNENGVVLYSFCSVSCRNEWLAATDAD